MISECNRLPIRFKMWAGWRRSPLHDLESSWSRMDIQNYVECTKRQTLFHHISSVKATDQLKAISKQAKLLHCNVSYSDVFLFRKSNGVLSRRFPRYEWKRGDKSYHWTKPHLQDRLHERHKGCMPQRGRTTTAASLLHQDSHIK